MQWRTGIILSVPTDIWDPTQLIDPLWHRAKCCTLKQYGLWLFLFLPKFQLFHNFYILPKGWLKTIVILMKSNKAIMVQLPPCTTKGSFCSYTQYNAQPHPKPFASFPNTLQYCNDRHAPQGPHKCKNTMLISTSNQYLICPDRTLPHKFSAINKIVV